MCYFLQNCQHIKELAKFKQVFSRRLKTHDLIGDNKLECFIETILICFNLRISFVLYDTTIFQFINFEINGQRMGKALFICKAVEFQYQAGQNWNPENLSEASCSIRSFHGSGN